MPLHVLLLIVYLVYLIGLPAQATVVAISLPQLSEVLSVNEALLPARNSCDPQPTCPGLPPVLDTGTSTMEYRVSDSLMHASCPVERDFSSCAPLPSPLPLENIQGGLMTSFARYSTNDLATALQADRRVSDFVSSTQGRFRGLCDVSFYSPYGLDQIRSCMRLPGMIGVGELNINGEGTMSASYTTDKNRLLLGLGGQAYQRLAAIAETVKDAGGGVIMMHLADTHDESAPKTEIDALLEIASRFPTVNFVIAHSGLFHGEGRRSFGLDGLRKVGEHYRNARNRPRNLWTDLSGFLGDVATEEQFPDRCTFLRRQAELASAWRSFGMDRVLFGTDVSVGPRGAQSTEWVRKSVSAVVRNPFLLPEEKRQILHLNLERLITRR